MNPDEPLSVIFETLPTGKPHISFSEVRVWVDCSFRHKLQFVQKIDLGKPGVHMDFGTAAHSACENFLKTKVMDVNVFIKKFTELWEEHKAINPEAYTEKAFQQFLIEGLAILSEVPAWLDEQFPGWTFVDAEHLLYEKIGESAHAFKGFIDCVIAAPYGKKKKMVTWLIDFKTTSWGWGMDKKTDEMVKAQLVLYKNFWSKKVNVDPKDIKCGFVLLKRTAKPGAKCELIEIPVGPTTTERSLKIVNNMLSCVKKGIAVKNRNSCTYCEFKGTQHCT
jgi:hypothetical protein